MAKIGIVRATTLSRLNRWDAPHVLHLKAEVEARGGSIDDDVALTNQADADLKWLEKNQQRERKLPMPQN